MLIKKNHTSSDPEYTHISRMVDEIAKRIAGQKSEEPILDVVITVEEIPVSERELSPEELELVSKKTTGYINFLESDKDQLAAIEYLTKLQDSLRKKLEEQDKIIEAYEKKKRWEIFSRYLPFCKKSNNFDDKDLDEKIDEYFKIAYLKSQK